MKTTQPPVRLDRLEKLVKGDPAKKLAFLNQFLTLIRPETLALGNALQSENREQIKKTVHKIGPQLVFFGLPNVEQLVMDIERGAGSAPFSELQHLTNGLSEKIQNAVNEIESLIGDLSSQ